MLTLTQVADLLKKTKGAIMELTEKEIDVIAIWLVESITSNG